MVSRIMGVIAALFGLVGVISPRSFKNRLRRIVNFRMRFIVYLFIAVFAVFILWNAIRTEDMPARIAGIIGLIVAIKVIKLATAKSSEALSLWMDQRSLMFFRIWAFGFLVMGVMLFLS